MPSLLRPGHPAPWFNAPALSGNPNFSFNTTGGRYVLMLFHGSANHPAGAAALKLVEQHRALFDDDRACFFGVTIDPTDEQAGRIAQSLPGIRHFLDYDRKVSDLYGALPDGPGTDNYLPHWVLLDPALRTIAAVPVADGPKIMAELGRIVPQPLPDGHAPILIVPRVLEPELCRHLIALYEKEGGAESGFMREEDGKTVMRRDYTHKRRSDYEIIDEDLRKTLNRRMIGALVPAIERAYQFKVTRVERWTVACYDADVGGYFRPHRDNTTKGTAHRRFACTINLNAEEYEGGNLRFPEFGRRAYRAPTGGAVIFSCSLLHEALPVTKGRRYAFLPFFYDDAGAAIRAANNKYLADDVIAYPGAEKTPEAVD